MGLARGFVGERGAAVEGKEREAGDFGRLPSLAWPGGCGCLQWQARHHRRGGEGREKTGADERVPVASERERAGAWA